MSTKLRKNTKTVEPIELEETVEVVEAVGEHTKAEEVSVIDNAVKNATKAEAKVETATEPTTEPKVRINPKQDIRTFIGDQWYNLKAGKQVSVPRTVKEKLQKAGLLSPL